MHSTKWVAVAAYQATINANKRRLNAFHTGGDGGEWRRMEIIIPPATANNGANSSSRNEEGLVLKRKQNTILFDKFSSEKHSPME